MTADEKAAREWRGRVYKAADALGELAQAFLKGRGVRKDPARAYRYLRACASMKRSVMLRMQLAEMALRKIGTEGGEAEARRWLKEAAQLEHEVEPDERRYVSYAMVRYARMLSRGQGGKADGDEAVRWLSRAAYLKNGAAMIELGDMYRRGVGVPRDPAKAVQWYRKVETESKGGDMVPTFGAPRNPVRSVARIRLGDMHAGGELGPKDYKKAYECYDSAQGGYAFGPYPMSRLRMAQLLLEGKGVQRDLAKAIEYLTYAAKQDLPEAMLEMGRIHEQGLGVEADAAKARHWYQRAVKADPSLKDRIDKKWLAPAPTTQPAERKRDE